MIQSAHRRGDVVRVRQRTWKIDDVDPGPRAGDSAHALNHDPAAVHLRELRAAMDRTMLTAYGQHHPRR